MTKLEVMSLSNIPTVLSYVSSVILDTAVAKRDGEGGWGVINRLISELGKLI